MPEAGDKDHYQIMSYSNRRTLSTRPNCLACVLQCEACVRAIAPIALTVSSRPQSLHRQRTSETSKMSFCSTRACHSIRAVRYGRCRRGSFPTRSTQQPAAETQCTTGRLGPDARGVVVLYASPDQNCFCGRGVRWPTPGLARIPRADARIVARKVAMQHVCSRYVSRCGRC